jgi:hypothetical protein
VVFHYYFDLVGLGAIPVLHLELLHCTFQRRVVFPTIELHLEAELELLIKGGEQ